MTILRRLGILVPALIIPWLCGEAAQGDMKFKIVPIDAGAAESAAVADFNNDRNLDIVSAGSWYEAPQWTKRPIRTIPVSSGYVDSFSDLPLDVDGDGFMDVIQIGYFAHRIVWMKNPGTIGGPGTEEPIARASDSGAGAGRSAVAHHATSHSRSSGRCRCPGLPARRGVGIHVRARHQRRWAQRRRDDQRAQLWHLLVRAARGRRVAAARHRPLMVAFACVRARRYRRRRPARSGDGEAFPVAQRTRARRRR